MIEAMRSGLKEWVKSEKIFYHAVKVEKSQDEIHALFK